MEYDNPNNKNRFLWFLGFIAIPYSLLAGFNFTLGCGYAGLMILWRHISYHQIKNKEINKNEY